MGIDIKKEKNDIAVIGLGNMGSNLALNIAGKGYRVTVFDIIKDKAKRLAGSCPSGLGVIVADSLDHAVMTLSRPRKILLMVSAGITVDKVIDELKPFLDARDIILDGGNSHFRDTERRQSDLKKYGIYLIGMGISGGRKGALYGPAIMPGGDSKAYKSVSKILEDIAARAKDGRPCVSYKGRAGAGHYLKMVHNGIEYAEMQLLGECYWSMRAFLKSDIDKVTEIFRSWKKVGDRLDSYLLEATVKIISKQKTGKQRSRIIDDIADHTDMKGTGTWAVISSLEQLVPIPTIAEAVFSREISMKKDLRVDISKKLQIQKNPDKDPGIDIDDLSRMAHDSLLIAKLVAYAQGFDLIQDASSRFGYGFDLSNIALDWRAGCIIRSAFLNELAEYLRETQCKNILLYPAFMDLIRRHLEDMGRFISLSGTMDVPMPCTASAYNYILQLSSRKLISSQLTAAQRDFFGSHGYLMLKDDGETIVKDKDGKMIRFYSEW